MDNMIRDSIDEIIENFNFDKVHMAMTMLDWKWAGENGDAVPSMKELKDTARRLLTEAYKDGVEPDYAYNVVATGGFEAYIYDNNAMELKFVLDNFETDGYDTEED